MIVFVFWLPYGRANHLGVALFFDHASNPTTADGTAFNPWVTIQKQCHYEYICSTWFVLLVRFMLPLWEIIIWIKYSIIHESRLEKTALSAASHKDHDGEVEHDDDCAHEGYHGYDDHDAEGHDSDNDDDDDDDNDG